MLLSTRFSLEGVHHCPWRGYRGGPGWWRIGSDVGEAQVEAVAGDLVQAMTNAVIAVDVEHPARRIDAHARLLRAACERLIAGANLELEDDRYHSTPLGWAVHGFGDPPAGNHGHQREVAALLVAQGAKVRPAWLNAGAVLADALMLRILRGEAP